MKYWSSQRFVSTLFKTVGMFYWYRFTITFTIFVDGQKSETIDLHFYDNSEHKFLRFFSPLSCRVNSWQWVLFRSFATSFHFSYGIFRWTVLFYFHHDVIMTAICLPCQTHINNFLVRCANSSVPICVHVHLNCSVGSEGVWNFAIKWINK